MVFVFAFWLLAAGPAPVAPDNETRAVEAMQTWLGLIDQGDYDTSWTSASRYLKGMVTAEQWLQAMKGARDPLGKVLSRTLKSAENKASLPGAPDGEYVVIMFETSFENKKNAIETLAAMKDNNGTWKPAGYYIQ